MLTENRWQDQVEPWITKQYAGIYDSVVKFVVGELDVTVSSSQFTLHDSTHLKSVEAIARRLVSHGIDVERRDTLIETPPKHWPLSPTERLILSCACWLHDLGMMDEYMTRYARSVVTSGLDYSTDRARDEHETISSFAINWEKTKLFPKKVIRSIWDGLQAGPYLDGADEESASVSVNIAALQENIANTIGICIKYHRRKHSIGDCPEVRLVFDNPVRLRLLAAFLRAADAIHLDRSRVPNLRVGMLDLSHRARIHWLKSYATSSIYEDPVRKEVAITFDVPDTWNNDVEKRNWSDRANKFFTIIKNDVEEELFSVNRVFAAAGMPVYLYVHYRVDHIPGVPQAESDLLWRTLNDVDLSFAQSSSHRLQIFSDTAVALTEKILEGGNLRDRLESQFDRLICHIEEENTGERWCHFGLSNIIKWYREKVGSDTTNRNWATVKTFFESVAAYQQSIAAFYRNPDSYIYKQPWASEMRNATVVIAFSKSQTVVNALEGLGMAHDRVRVVVLEGSPRSRYIANNTLIYHDGLHFAADFAAHGFKRIELFPDVAVGSVIEECADKHETPVIVMGTNGIDPKLKRCYHALGHTTIIQVAASCKVKVALFAEDLKIAQKARPDGYVPSERDDAWLFTQTSEDLKSHRHLVKLRNPREATMVIENIDWVITERGNLKDSEPEVLEWEPSCSWMLERDWKKTMLGNT